MGRCRRGTDFGVVLRVYVECGATAAWHGIESRLALLGAAALLLTGLDVEGT